MPNTKSLVSYYGGREQRRRFIWGSLVAIAVTGILCAALMAGMLCLLYERMPH